MKLLKLNRGFTLIEVVTIVVVLSILALFTSSFIDNAVKTYMLAKKQSSIYREASYIMERITREIRDAQWITNSIIFYPNSIYFYKRNLAATNLIDKNRYVLIIRDNSNNLYRYSQSTSDPFWSPALSTNNIIGRNVNRFEVNFVNSSPYFNDRVNITLEMTDPQDSTIKIILQETISPKNLRDDSSCFWWPWWCFSVSYDYANRTFNGDYEDVVQ